MRDLWLTYDTPKIDGVPSNVMSILEDCEVDTDENGNTVIKGGREVLPDIDELKKIAKIFNDAITNLEEDKA